MSEIPNEKENEENTNKKSTRAEMVKKVIVTQLSVEPDKVTPSSSFVDLGADSLDVVELIMKFEEDFEIEIPDEEAEKLITVQDVLDFIEKNAA